MELMISLPSSTLAAAPERVILNFLSGCEFFGTSGMLTSHLAFLNRLDNAALHANDVGEVNRVHLNTKFLEVIERQ